MRLWHKDLIPVLPRQQLVAQWRELCCIVKNIATNGEPNHILVNKVLDYSYFDFKLYSVLVREEMTLRGYTLGKKAEREFENNLKAGAIHFGSHVSIHSLYEGWHDDRYLLQCYFNLQEKYDCVGITDEEWLKIRCLVQDRLSKYSFHTDILNLL